MAAKRLTRKKPKAALPVEFSAGEQKILNRQFRLDSIRTGKGSSFATVTPRKRVAVSPVTTGLGDRSAPKLRAGIGFTEMARGGDILEDGTFASEELPDIQKKIRKKIEHETDYLNSYYGHYGTILPEYDMYEPYTLIDTESYLLQALKRKHSLMFRQGFSIQGENERFTSYVNRRLNQITYMMSTTIGNFIKDILWNLLILSNCFLLKIRDKDGSGGTANDKNGQKIPVAGYIIIPPHSIFPFINEKGEIIKWRRYYGSARKFKDYKVEDIIHFKWDVKPGHVYGTPRTAPVRDDIFALRRLEENVELLLINHLFPLFHVKVGSEEAPADFMVDGISEVDLIKAEIENMPKEGVFVTDERVAVDVVGVKSEAMDPQQIMDHYKKRILAGLGVSPIDVGEADTGNRATAENVSQNLKDSVKSDLAWFTGQFKTFIIKELFEESPNKLSVQSALLDVDIVFPDVDVDGHIKWQNHVTDLYNNHLVHEDEARRMIQKSPYTQKDAKKTHYELHVKDLQQSGILLKNKGMIEAMAVRGEVAAGKAKDPSKSKASKGSKSVATKNRPTNQHGRALGPTSARSSMDPSLLYDLLIQAKKEMPSKEEWKTTSAKVIDKFVSEQAEVLNDAQVANEFAQLAKDRVANTTDPDMISILLNDLVEELFTPPVQEA